MNDNASGGKFDPAPEDPFEALRASIDSPEPKPTRADDPFEALQKKLESGVGEDTSSDSDDEEVDWGTEASTPEFIEPVAADSESESEPVEEAALEPEAAFEPEPASEPEFAFDSTLASFEPAVEPATDPTPEPMSFGENPVVDEATEEEKNYESATMAALARMGKSLDLDDEPASMPDPISPVMKASSMPATPPTTAPASSGQGGDESINDYMAQLLQRVGGGEGEDPSAGQTAESSGSGSKTKPAAGEKARRMPKPPPTHQDPPKPVEKLKELPPIKRRAPEHGMDLAAMRELANQTNRTAIQSHARKQRKEASSARFMLSVALVLGALIMFFIPYLPIVTRSIIGTVMLVVGILSCLKAMKIDALGKFQEKFRRGGR